MLREYVADKQVSIVLLAVQLFVRANIKGSFFFIVVVCAIIYQKFSREVSSKKVKN